MRMPRLLASVTLMGLLVACSTSPSNEYYRLTANVAGSPSGESPSLGIGPIAIPAYLDRERLVYALDGNQVQLARSALWAEPLDSGIERVLALNLATRLDTQNVRTFPWHPKRAPDYGVKLTVLTMDANKTEAQLTVEWLVYRPAGSAPVERRISRLRTPTPAGAEMPTQLPAVFSEMLDELSAEIAEVIRAHAASGTPEDT